MIAKEENRVTEAIKNGRIYGENTCVVTVSPHVTMYGGKTSWQSEWLFALQGMDHAITRKEVHLDTERLFRNIP